MPYTPPHFVPMRSVGQFGLAEEGGPTPYMWNIAGPLGTIQGELHWHFFDLCRFHQVIYEDLKSQVAKLDERWAHYKRMLDEQENSISDEELEVYHVHESRISDSFLDRDREIERLKNFADEFCIVGLWASAEQYLGKVFAHLEHHQSEATIANIYRPYRWTDFLNHYSQKSITLTSLNGFSDADECRVLNNTIKHAGVVTQQLARFKYFAPYMGVPLAKIDFEMQRYLNGIFNFLGSLVESGNRLLDRTFDD